MLYHIVLVSGIPQCESVITTYIPAFLILPPPSHPTPLIVTRRQAGPPVLYSPIPLASYFTHACPDLPLPTPRVGKPRLGKKWTAPSPPSLAPAGEDGPQPGVPAGGVCHRGQCSGGLVWANRRAGWRWERATGHHAGHQAARGAEEKVTPPGLCGGGDRRVGAEGSLFAPLLMLLVTAGMCTCGTAPRDQAWRHRSSQTPVEPISVGKD